MIKKLAAALLLSASAAALAVPLGSQSVLVVDDAGKVIVEKNAGAIVPIASLTKLMTAMVVLDSRLDMQEQISIDREDVDTLKHSTSRVPVGATLSRADVLHLALMSSDNRAAASLARTFPGGPAAFKAAVNAKIRALGMTRTRIDEPTGLSPHNTSTAEDLVKMAAAAARYPTIASMTTDKSDIMQIKGRQVEYHNTNRLVGAKGWDIGLSKTGYTEEAGRCLIMRIKAAGKNATMVLLNASGSSARIADALNIRRLITGNDEPRAITAATKVRGNPVSAKMRMLPASTKVRKATAKSSVRKAAAKSSARKKAVPRTDKKKPVRRRAS
ncbi:serine hydrolase [Pseudoduganella sp. SL102]|uniref:serine hydrolase n=1 Tax=Pseudoduganella sp. SL102 TaxID=2995154 RepID=UPI00248C5344|nr:serine hydrolase [Pseudoduganella sp. SL102]WBS00857.1 serine hydrolase [Pseudoduganella sp. SL102]